MSRHLTFTNANRAIKQKSHFTERVEPIRAEKVADKVPMSAYEPKNRTLLATYAVFSSIRKIMEHIASVLKIYCLP